MLCLTLNHVIWMAVAILALLPLLALVVEMCKRASETRLRASLARAVSQSSSLDPPEERDRGADA